MLSYCSLTLEVQLDIMRETEVPAPELLGGLLCDKINVMLNYLFLLSTHIIPNIPF